MFKFLHWLALGWVLAVGGVASGQSDGPAGRDLYGDGLPRGASARLGTTRFRHKADWGKGMTFLPDGQTLIVVGGTELHFFETKSGRSIRELSVEPMNIRAFALSSDGTQLAIAGFWYSEDRTQVTGQVRILDPATGTTIRSLVRESRDVDAYSLAFTPDGKMLISLGTSGVLRVEELAGGSEILTEKFARDNSPSLTLSPDGSTIAVSTGANTGKFFLWKWQSGEAPRELKIAGGREYGELRFSPDGTQLAASLGYSAEPVHICDVASGKLLRRLKLPNAGTHARGAVAYSPDGRTVAATGYRNDSATSSAIHFWNATTGEYAGRLDAIGCGRPVFSADGKLLVAAGDSEVRIWKWPSREEVAPNDAVHRGNVSRLAAAAGNHIVSASDDQSIRVWDVVTQKQLWKFEHSYWVRDIAVSPDGAKLVSSSLDDTVRLWDLATGREIYRLPGHGRMGGTRAVGFAADGQSFGSFGDDMYLRMWDVRTGKALLEHKLRPTGVTIPEDEGERLDFFHIDQARFSPDAKLFALSIGKHFLFDMETGRELRTIDNRGSNVVSLAISPDSRFLLASAWGKPKESKLADGRTHYSSATEQPITLWDIQSGEVRKEVMLAAGGVGPASFSADGSLFAVSATKPQGKITIYRTADATAVQAIEDVPGRPSVLCFTRDGRSIVSGHTDSTALVWMLKPAQ